MSGVSGSNLWDDLEGLDSEGITRIVKDNTPIDPMTLPEGWHRSA